MSRQRLINLLRGVIWLALLSPFFIWHESYSLTEISKGDPPLFYTNQCHDDLREMFLQAIEKAKQSIVLIIYSLSDEKIVRALNKRSDEGLSVTVIHDCSTLKKRLLRARIETDSIQIKGLMHEKILIVDEQLVWIGSANFTTSSLMLDDNLIVACSNSKLARSILEKRGSGNTFVVGGQPIEFWRLPDEKGLGRLVEIIDGAKEAIEVAMYTWTHPQLTEAIIQAHKRGVRVKVLLDRAAAFGASSKACKQLLQNGVCVALSTGGQLLHHKCMWVDKTTLVAGSTNWTRSAFSRNYDCFLIVCHLNHKQRDKLQKMWDVLNTTCRLADKKHFSILGQRPMGVGDNLFELVHLLA